MKIAVFSDIHANLPALQAILADIQNYYVDRMICLGDLVGYAPLPNETIETVRTLNIPVIMGNYDQGVGHDLDDCGCAYRTDEEKRLGQISLEWTKKKVTQENKTYLRSLLPRYELEAGNIRNLFVHGSPRRINEYLFPDRPDVSFLHMMEKKKAISSYADTPTSLSTALSVYLLSLTTVVSGARKMEIGEPVGYCSPSGIQFKLNSGDVNMISISSKIDIPKPNSLKFFSTH